MYLTVTMKPNIKVTEQTVRYWIAKHRVAIGSVIVQTVEELESQYGDEVRRVAAEHGSYHKLIKALESRDPPLKVTSQVAKNWLRRFGGDGRGVSDVLNAGHLECGTVSKSAMLPQKLARTARSLVPGC